MHLTYEQARKLEKHLWPEDKPSPLQKNIISDGRSFYFGVMCGPKNERLALYWIEDREDLLTVVSYPTGDNEHIWGMEGFQRWLEDAPPAMIDLELLTYL